MLTPTNIFISPSKGKLTAAQIINDVALFISEDTRYKYRIIIGTDSQNHTDTEFVIAIIVHRVGNGGRYYWQRLKAPKITQLRPRIYQEALLSIQVANVLFKQFERRMATIYKLTSKPELEIHVDIGQVGKTRELIKEVIGMIQGNGYQAKIKPESFGASKIADRYT
ncbi:MAG: hypothetical protein A2666_04625 [Parcubacteria group bacterium RIFCSPHIGHO2_01_FULL_47_10b]|nr:MAG: hypothetical protein A2666_04625 [Parcubacteria group bacterium RIFCSPHIGHO2_01_FULL_47_10b]